MKIKKLTVLFLFGLITFNLIAGDTLIGKCRFHHENDAPRYTTMIGSMTVYHNGDFKKKSVEGKYDCYEGSGRICVIFNTKKVAETFKFIGKGNIQTCINY